MAGPGDRVSQNAMLARAFLTDLASVPLERHHPMSDSGQGVRAWPSSSSVWPVPPSQTSLAMKRSRGVVL